MKTVTALLCAVMALTIAAALAEEQPGQEPTERHLVKRSTYCCYGWTPINGRCFRYNPKPMSWTAAEKSCQAKGGNLASVHNIREYRVIQYLIMKGSHQNKPTWIGGSDAQEEKKWLWTDGSEFDYILWSAGEPNNGRGRQHCLRMNHGGDRAWDDVECRVKAPSICAKKT
ncbi:galactose-specific lectin nattectin-like [Pungitius pungitius]|uniref:galactose-specific lectin nattectin-like n=1 Tax=Pungitius pungitius TaxID=134920 RepID=UPI002E0E315F